MKTPLVSVVIPVYNVERYLEECLNSVLRQTYQPIEIIAINDGSTDRSPDILHQYEQKYRNLKVLHQENQGNSVARNRGIEEATGKYIYFLDSDDYILPETIENLVGAMEKHNLDLIRFGAEPFLDDVDYKEFDKNLYNYSKFFNPGKVYNKVEFLRANIRGFSPSPCLYLLKRELLIQNGIRFLPGIMHEDELFSLQVYLHTNRAMYDPNFYYKRRYRAGSLMTSQSQKVKKSFDSYLQLLEQIFQLSEKCRSQFEKKLIKSRIRSIYIGLYFKQVDGNYKRKRLKEIKRINCFEKKYYIFNYKFKELIKAVLKLFR